MFTPGRSLAWPRYELINLTIFKNGHSNEQHTAKSAGSDHGTTYADESCQACAGVIQKTLP
jgi:hypothetical protein